MTTSSSGPRICPSCGLLVAADAAACQCGHVFSAASAPGSAAARLRDAADLFSAREALSIAFQGVSELKGGLVGWMVVVGVLELLPQQLVGPMEPNAPLREVGIMLLLALVQAWTGYTMSRAALAHLRGEPVSIWRARIAPGVFLRILLAILVMTVPVLIGTLLFIAPGVYLALTWSQVSFLIFDGRSRSVDALRASEELTRDRRLEILLAMIVPILLQVPAKAIELGVPTGGSMLTPGFVLFLVSTIWQMLVVTYGVWVSAVVYQMLLNRKKTGVTNR